MNYFLTGTDTGAGKTHVACLLLRAWRTAGRPSAGFKPICCGGREDAFALAAAGTGGLSVDDVNPVWLRMPASPLTASRLENTVVDVEKIRAAYAMLAARFDPLLVEGAGGWEVPVRSDYLMSDLAAELRLPVIVVVNNKLGALNHTILTVRAIERRGLTCRGLILNQVTDTRDPASISHRSVLEDLLGIPVLAEILHGEEELDARVAAEL